MNNNLKAPKCYAAMASDEIRLNKSSSGGIFTLIANEVLKNNGIVVGASFDEGETVNHIIVDNYKDLEKLKGSKYVQSNINDIYKKIKQYLDKNIKVLFTGTPCQIAGLKSYLSKEYENLMTIDIVCHGVPSPMVFRKYLKEKFGNSTQIVDINFRDKINGWSSSDLIITFQAHDFTVSEKDKENEYITAFLKNYILRKSCFNCPFQKLPRQGDITIGDFWKIQKYDENLDDKKGTSVVLVNNKKGQE